MFRKIFISNVLKNNNSPKIINKKFFKNYDLPSKLSITLIDSTTTCNDIKRPNTPRKIKHFFS